MKFALEQWPVIRKQIEHAEYVCLFLDFDGTLTPIVETPDKAVLSDEMRALLQRLMALPACKVAVISGRELRDLKEKVRLKNVAYVGNHGFEIEGEDINFHSLVSLRARTALDRIKAEAAKIAVQFPGVLIEDKGATLSIHYRLVDPKMEKDFIGSLERTVRPCIQEKELRMVEGKKVFEFRPPVAWDKGKAVRWLLKQLMVKEGKADVLPVFIGDDRTDEDVFSDLKDSGVTIVVGKRNGSRAQYFLDDTAGVYKFLTEVSMVLKEKVHAD